jgi:hypothetical protein
MIIDENVERSMRDLNRKFMTEFNFLLDQQKEKLSGYLDEVFEEKIKSKKKREKDRMLLPPSIQSEFSPSPKLVDINSFEFEQNNVKYGGFSFLFIHLIIIY